MLAELRELLNVEPSGFRFTTILGYLRDYRSHSDFDVALDYADQHLKDWGDKLRSCSSIFPLGCPTMRLVRNVAWSIKEMVDVEDPHSQDRGAHLRILTLLLEMLEGNPYATAITTWDFAGEYIDHVLLQRILWSPRFDSVKNLILWDNLIGDDGAMLIAGSRKMVRLQGLDLGHNVIGDAGGLALSNSYFLYNLQRLDLRFNRFSAKTMKALFDSPNLRNKAKENLSL